MFLDLDQTKDNMAHYRGSCQNLSKELKSTSEALAEYQTKYEMLMKKESQAAFQRTDSGSSLGEYEDQLMKPTEEPSHPAESNEQPENLGEELNELADLGDADNELMEAEFDGNFDDNTGVIEMDNSEDELQELDQDFQQPYEEPNDQNLDQMNDHTNMENEPETENQPDPSKEEGQQEPQADSPESPI